MSRPNQPVLDLITNDTDSSDKEQYRFIAHRIHINIKYETMHLRGYRNCITSASILGYCYLLGD